MIIIGIILILVVLIIIFAITTYNAIITLKNQTEEGFSTMDVYLKKRFDLIPNLVATVKGYAAHEAETLEKVIEKRNTAYQAGEAGKIVQAEADMSNTIRGIFALSENYPQLKANENFIDLQKQLQSIENDISNARKYYNGCVKQYNTKIQMFPASIIAGMFHFEKLSYFEVDNDTERKNVKVEF